MHARRIQSERGFTLIELLVVIIINAILSAIALPAFLGQRAKAQDGSAKSNARTVVSAMEACYTEAARYDPCPDAPTGVSIGTLRGQVSVAPSGDAYTIVAYSHTGNTFTVEKAADSTVTRSCDTSAGTPRGGCTGTSW